jgi:hypothetical protein
MLSKRDETPKGPNHCCVFVVLQGHDGRRKYRVVGGYVVADRCSTEHREWLEGKKQDGTQRKNSYMRTFQPRAGENFRDRWDDIDDIKV